jgi:dipeptidyl aminopeptidase/acylaminoacyl peptidase
MVNMSSLRQMTTPDWLQGRVTATMRFVSRSSVPLGAFLGGTNGTANYRDVVAAPDGRWLACEVDVPDRLPEVWLVATDGSQARPLTTASRQLAAAPGLRLGVPELVRWRSLDGLALEGLLLYPPEYGPDRRPSAPLPTVVDVHGGPVNTTPALRLGEHPLYLDGLHRLASHG